MRIKQIELNGFKAFMERTALELPGGVTAIVGPNGCGKSNVVDAIRWVLGEQSPKHLRGTVMEDVIFSGNAENGPLGMAEVSLLFERDEGDFAQVAAEGDDAASGLPPELATASEVLVTRRYFRSGESEYFINRAPCRLKDITELFLGTGVGTKAYAIIEQGRVEQLVNAKPEELRLFLEEAAGTTRFRSRKVAAERKMARTRENLLRVQDVLTELERQMASLERQARRAEEYHRIRGELRDLDLQVMAARRRAWTADLERLGTRLSEAQKDEAQLHDAIRETRGATSEAQAARTANADRLRSVEHEITEQRLAATDARSRGSNLVTRSHELAERAAQADRERAHVEGRLEALAREAEGLRAEVERLEAEARASAAEAGTAEARVAELAAAGTPLEAAVEEAKDTLLDAQAELMRVRNTVDALRQRRDDLAGRRRRLDDEQRRLGERLRANAQGSEAARAAIARLDEERTALAAERARRVQAAEEIEAAVAAQGAAVEGARAETTGLRTRAESLHDLEKRYEGCTRGVASLLGREGEDTTLLASLLRVPAGLERAVATALGARLTQVVVSDTASAVGAIGWLKNTDGGSATTIPRDAERRAPVIVPPGRRLLDQIEVGPDHWALAEALLGHVLLADDLEDALRVWRAAAHAVTVVTPLGEAIDAFGAVSGGSEAPIEETVLARQRELRELEGALAVSAERLRREEEQLAVLRAQQAETIRAVSAADERARTIQVERVATEKDRERLEEERARIAAELEVGALEAGSLAGEDDQMAGELAALDGRLATVERTVTDHRNRLAERQTALAAWRGEQAEAERARTAAAVRAAAVAERIRGVRNDVEGCASRRQELEERLTHLEAEARQAREGAETAEQEAVDAETVRGEAVARTAELEQERERLGAAITELDRALASDDAAEREARERLEVLRQDYTELEVAMTKCRLEIEHLAGQLRERYELELTALDGVTLQDDGRDEERSARVEALRSRLTRLGDVNPGALTELEELRQRREFLVGQRDDLDRSLDDLRRTITKLTRTSRQRFEETFAAANEKLAETFPKLFPNGKARLELTEPIEGGEPGVEIVVQPAGKKLQSLTLLSGGEKALTAVALILSLFLIRPTPFCVLDEVDAPLDEANIGRFNDLVRHMAATSQFVLITHNRRTMEVADTLYGITMQQAGVSKVVSVRLREAA